MAKLIEFDNILEFKKYVSQLKNEDILSFSYKDWVLLFESIERLNEKLLNEEDFEDTLEFCKEITLSDCKGNIITRFLQDICRLFAPLM